MSSTTATQVTETGGRIAPGRLAPDLPRPTPIRDGAEAALRRTARRQGLLLLIASSAAMIALIAGILLSFR
ncbi:MAG TPA: hypothetical protein VGG99_04520 [Acetobacteraceae bacterium]|jgi:hypothetical protein